MKLAHIDHQGLNKTKSLLRSQVCFFNMDKMVAEQQAFSIPCQSLHKKPKLPPRNSTEIPKKVCQTYRVLGAIPNRKYILVMID